MLKIKPKIQPSAVEFSTVKVKIETQILNNFHFLKYLGWCHSRKIIP